MLFRVNSSQYNDAKPSQARQTIINYLCDSGLKYSVNETAEGCAFYTDIQKIEELMVLTKYSGEIVVGYDENQQAFVEIYDWWRE